MSNVPIINPFDGNLQLINNSTGSGTVTSIATTAPISGGPITTTGTITTSMSTNKLIGRGTSGTGVMEEITLGTNLSLSGTTLNATGGGGTPAGNTGDIQINTSGAFDTGASDSLFFDKTDQLFGVQTVGIPTAAGHFVSAKTQTAGTVSGLSSSTQTQTLNTPSGDSVTSTSPLTVGSYNGSATINYGSGSYTATGNSYSYTIYNLFTTGGITYYSPVQAICNAGTDDSSSSPFNISISWTATPTGGGYVGTVIARVTNFGGTQYFDATGQGGVGSSGSITDDGSGSPYNWGSSSFPSGYTASPDFISNGSTYNYDVWAQQTSPSGHPIYVMGDSPSFSDGSITSGLSFGLQLNNANGFTVKYHETSPNSSFYKIITASSSFTQRTDSSADSSTLTPNSYGYNADVSATPQYYRVTAYKLINGSNIFGASPAWVTNNADTLNFWYSFVSWSSLGSAATGYMVEYSTDGITATKHFDNGNSTTFYDDTLTVWIGGAASLSPTSYLPPTGLFIRNNVDNGATTIFQDSRTTSAANPTTNFIDGNNLLLLQVSGNQSNSFIDSPVGNLVLESNAQDVKIIGQNILASVSSGFGINNNTPTSTLHTGGSLALPMSNASVGFTFTDSTWGINVLTGTGIVTLPSASAKPNRIHIVKNSGTGAVSVTTVSGQTIDGNASPFVISNQNACYWFQSEGSNWIIISSYLG